VGERPFPVSAGTPWVTVVREGLGCGERRQRRRSPVLTWVLSAWTPLFLNCCRDRSKCKGRSYFFLDTTLEHRSGKWKEYISCRVQSRTSASKWPDRLPGMSFLREFSFGMSTSSRAPLLERVRRPTRGAVGQGMFLWNPP